MIVIEKNSNQSKDTSEMIKQVYGNRQYNAFKRYHLAMQYRTNTSQVYDTGQKEYGRESKILVCWKI